MTDLERFLDRLVRNLVASDPGRISQPIPIAEIKSEILPYRTNRRALALESNDEYEELLIRLVGEEDDLVKTAPREVAEWCQNQMSNLSPDLSGIPGQTNATIEINPNALAKVLGEDAVMALARSGSGGHDSEALPMPPERCMHCDAVLPKDRVINFCQICGRSVTMVPCDHCGADMEPGWRYCVACGQEATENTGPGS